MKTIKIALHHQMLIALVLGILCGWVFNGCYSIWRNIVYGIGQIFLHALSMIVVPLVFLSTVLSISKIDSTRSMGEMAKKSFSYFVITAIIAAVIAVVIADIASFKIDASQMAVSQTIESPQLQEIMENADKVTQMTPMDKVVNIVPENIFEAFAADNMMPILFFSLTLGYFITKIRADRRNVVNELFESFQEVIMKITDFIIKLSPIGTFAIVMNLVGQQSDKIWSYSKIIFSFIGLVRFALIVVGVFLFVATGRMAKLPRIEYLKRIIGTLMLAFSARSSHSVMPQMMENMVKMGVSEHLTNFTIPLGITFNKIGTIIYECMAVLFVAQACQVEMDFGSQVSLICVSIITVMAAPSIPMAGVTFLAILLKIMKFEDGQIVSYMGLLYAIDFLCDMPKTMLNAYSVCCGTVIVARSEGETLRFASEK